MQELSDFLKEFNDYYMTSVHTSMPAVVVSYNAATRRAVIQPSIKRRMADGSYMKFPILIDVPVLYSGTVEYTIHFPLHKDDEVLLFFAERCIEEWKLKGNDNIEDTDPRRYDLCDAYCIPGLQPQKFIPAVDEDALQIIHYIDDKEKSQIELNDNKMEHRIKDGNIHLFTTDSSGTKETSLLMDINGNIKMFAGNGKATLNILNEDKVEVNGNDYHMVKYEQLWKAVQLHLDSENAHIHTCTGCGAPTTPPTPITFPVEPSMCDTVFTRQDPNDTPYSG